MQLPGRFPSRTFFKCDAVKSDQVKALKMSWATWLTTQIMVIFDHLRKMKRNGIRQKMYRNQRNGGLSEEDIENLEIFIGVIEDAVITPQKTIVAEARPANKLGRWDSGVSDVTSDDSSGSQLVLSQKHLARWDSGVSDCSHITAASPMKKSPPHQDMIRFAISECFSISKCQTNVLGNYF